MRHGIHWKPLYQGFEKVNTSKFPILRRDFESPMEATESVELFYTRVIGLINQLKYHGENIEDKRIVEKFM